MAVEQYIASFHSRLDKIESLNLDHKLKWQQLLLQDSLTSQDKNLIVGAASGSYEVSHLVAALRIAYVRTTPADSTMTWQSNANANLPPRHNMTRVNRWNELPNSEFQASINLKVMTVPDASPTREHHRLGKTTSPIRQSVQ